MGYKYLILDNYHPDILYLRERECEDTWLFSFRIQKGSANKKHEKHCAEK